MTSSPSPGSWPSPITADRAVAAGRNLEAVAFAGTDLWWSEVRPSEAGRIVVCTSDAAGHAVDLLPALWNARTRVHEYGGTSWLPVPGLIRSPQCDLVFANYADQRLYRLPSEAGAVPVPLTPPPDSEAGLRYADLQLDERRSRLLAVRETHHGDGRNGTVTRTLVAVPLDGSAGPDGSGIVDLLPGRPGADFPAGADFLAGPRLSTAGDALVWISWNHPDMPWNSTTVQLARLDHAGAVTHIQQVAGGPGVSVVEPGFLPDGSLLFLTDENGWWQPVVRDARTAGTRFLSTIDADFAPPLWVLGHRSWAAVPGGRLLVRPNGRPSYLDTFTGELMPMDPEWTAVSDLVCDRSGRTALIVGGDTRSAEVVLVDPEGSRRTVRSAVDEKLPTEYLPIPVEKMVGGVHAVAYPPTHPEHTAAPGTAPVLITIHGGPTSQHARTLSSTTAYFTSRGFAVAAVDHRGSTGYGRPYRDALDGNWAQLDIEDAITVARGLLTDGTAGSALISGGSAGGLTVLGALTTVGNPFAAGASYFGIGDLTALVTSTHDFESRYLDRLLGTDPAVLQERSPLRHADRLATPVLLLQGGKDPVVTPDQAESFAAACEAKGVPHALIVFPEEGHGFRAADARTTALEAELAFYGQVLGFDTPGVPPIPLT